MSGARKKWCGVVRAGVWAAAVVAGVWAGAGLMAAEGGGAGATSKPAGAAVGAATEAGEFRVPVTTEARAEILKLAAAPTMPGTVADLQAIQARVETVVKAVMPAVVSIQFENAQGSGVLVSKDGYILTAGHVSGTPGKTMRLVLADGRKVHGRALGANNGIDSGMIKIEEKGDYPFVPVGSAKKLAPGQWVVALGHPGGFVVGRPAVVRLGRVLEANSRWIGTDSPLISGDSGGPLFDLDGRLIGINSRIGPTTTANIHVPIDTFVDTWERLAKGDEWGGAGGFFDFPRGVPAGSGAVLGVTALEDEKGVKVKVVRVGSAAEKSGLVEGDIITLFNGKAVKTSEDLAEEVNKKHPGDLVTLGVLRAAKVVEISVKLGGMRRRGGG